jgi:GTPase Era involved in 16S rRNA processing
VDDAGALGGLRVEGTWQIFDRTDLGVLVTEAGVWDGFEEEILSQLTSRGTPAVVVFNKADVARPSGEVLERLAARRIRTVETVALDGRGSWTPPGPPGQRAEVSRSPGHPR